MGISFDTRRWFLWFPVFVALGNAVYFSLADEPSGKLVAVGALLLLSLFFGVRSRVLSVLRTQALSPRRTSIYTNLLFLCPCGIAFVLGFTASKIRTVAVGTSVLPRQWEDCVLAGDVEHCEDVTRGTPEHPRMVRRCTMRVRGEDVGLPVRYVRLRVQGPLSRLCVVGSGDQLVFRGSVGPPPIPLLPHGYDAPFDLYFKGISGVGKVREVVAVKRSSPLLKPITPWERVRDALTRQRESLTTYLWTVLPANVAALGTALITGERSGMSDAMREDFTRAGLSHLLAISGLHMGLVAGFVYLVLSWLLVLVPRLATRLVVKKVAAIATIPIIGAYLVISGASFSSWRAFLMVSMSMVAVVIDQKVVSLRMTAVAASCILLLFPESLFSVSFQLSFAAVTILCWAYEHKKVIDYIEATALKIAGAKASKWGYVKRCVILFALYSLVTTVMATLATTPIVLYVFQRMTFVGVIGNLLAVPFLGQIVVPVGLVAVLSMLVTPGGASFLWWLWGAVLEGLSRIASWVARLPGSDCLVPRPSWLGMILLAVGMLGVMLSQGKKRWVPAGICLVGLVVFPLERRTDAWVTACGDIIAVRQGEVVEVSSLRRGGFPAKVWARESGLRTVKAMNWTAAAEWRRRFSAELVRLRYRGDLLLLRRCGDTWESQLLKADRKRRPWWPAPEDDVD